MGFINKQNAFLCECFWNVNQSQCVHLLRISTRPSTWSRWRSTDTEVSIVSFFVYPVSILQSNYSLVYLTVQQTPYDSYFISLNQLSICLLVKIDSKIQSRKKKQYLEFIQLITDFTVLEYGSKMIEKRFEKHETLKKKMHGIIYPIPVHPRLNVHLRTSYCYTGHVPPPTCVSPLQSSALPRHASTSVLGRG